MQKIMLAVGLVFAAATMAIGDAAIDSNALAQSSGSSSYMKNSTGNADRTTPQAPVGHRQPRVGDVPSEKNLANPNDPVNKEDAVLDRKIKSICRGC
jgi:hypothetical protein